MRRTLLAALTLTATAAGLPAADAESLGHGCEVQLVLAPDGSTTSCTYTAPVPGNGTHSIMVYGGVGISEVTCTVGYDYLGQPAGRGWSWEFYREGSCVLTLTGYGNYTTATASAD